MIQTVVAVFCEGFGNYFWQEVYVIGTATTIAGVVKRAFAQELLPSPTRLEKLKKEDQLALAGDRCLIILLGMKASAGSVQRPSSGRSARGVFRLTFRVRGNQRRWRIHDVGATSFTAIWRAFHFPL